MKIKNSTCDDSLDNPNVAAKQLSDAVLEMNDNFKNALKGKFEKPWETIKRYKTTLNELDKTYKKTLLGNEKSKSGMYIGQSHNYSIETAMKEQFGFTVSRENQCMKYEKDKYYKLALVEVSLLFITYEQVYDFQIRFALLKLLLQRFCFYSLNWDETWDILCFRDGADDIETIYLWVMDTDMSDLPDIIDESVYSMRRKTIVSVLTAKDIMKPKCKEDLTWLFEDWMNQSDKKKIIASQYHTSESTAQRWMKKYGLLKKSNNLIHEERCAKEHEEIKTLIVNQHAVTNESIDTSTQTMIDALNSNNKMLTATIETLNKKIDALTREVEDLKTRNQELARTQLIGRLDNKSDDLFDLPLAPGTLKFSGQ